MEIEINGMLNNPYEGIKNYGVFERAIVSVGKFFLEHLGKEAMDGPKLFIDNAPSASGPVPIIFPVFDEYLIIKLGVEGKESEAQVAFQFSHELMHYVYYTKYGLKREMADEREEAICTAASLCVIAKIYKEELKGCVQYMLENVTDKRYRAGEKLAQKIRYDFDRLINEGENVFEEIWESED